MWFPRPSEWKPLVDSSDMVEANQYTRHLVYGNEHMDVILMYWPAGSRSTIHDHEDSSCWVNIVEGTVHEVQYAVPRLDRKFLEAEVVCRRAVKLDPSDADTHIGLGYSLDKQRKFPEAERNVLPFRKVSGGRCRAFTRHHPVRHMQILYWRTCARAHSRPN